MIDVEFDCYECCHSDSSFKIRMHSAPREGQNIRIHRDLVPEEYKDFGFEFDAVGPDNLDEYVSCEIVTVEHAILKNGSHLVLVDIEPYKI